MKINVAQLPCAEAEFLAKFEAYKAEREAHKLTVGVPAPFPEYEIYRTAFERGEDFEIIRDELQEEAKAAGRSALSELDELKATVTALQLKVTTIEEATALLVAAVGPAVSP